MAEATTRRPAKDLLLVTAGNDGFDTQALRAFDRRLAVDNYGPRVPLGGGAFSGKDGTKVDRSGAYIAREIAVDYTLKNARPKRYLSTSRAVGYPHPVEATVTIDGTQEKVIGVRLTPEGIITKLQLRTPGFRSPRTLRPLLIYKYFL